jgi:ABC-type glucose/galactose transport system permease subunit
MLPGSSVEFAIADCGQTRCVRLGSLLLVLWLIVGVIAVTVLAGPLNYVGVNPKIHDCRLPRPSR